MNRRIVAQGAAAASVVVSMLLVAYELRQNRSVAQMEAYYALVEALGSHQQTLATDPVITPLIWRVQTGELPEDFTEEEQFRIRLNYASLLTLWEGLYRSVATDVLPEDALDVVGEGGAFDNPYFRALWPELRPAYSVEFVSFFEDLDWIQP